MPRHSGALVDVSARTVRGRSGKAFPLRELEVRDDTLYYGRDFGDHSSIRYHERWLLPALGWVVNRFTPHPGMPPFWCDWYVDIDRIEVGDEGWRVYDCFLDVGIHEGSGYEVLDADELADGIEQGEIALPEALAALRSLNSLCKALPGLGFSGPALLDAYAPGLPR